MWKWTKRIGLGLACLIVALLLMGISYQFISEKMDEKTYPAPGALVDVGGYRLHMNHLGDEGPTVVFDSGMGCNSLNWALVQPAVAKFARTVSYDRAGQGWSEESPLERTSHNIVEELQALLKNAKIPGPYILVGHSFGGPNVLLYASRYPEEVAGVVLVDSSHEDQLKKMPSVTAPNSNLLMFLTYTGAIRLLTHSAEYKKLFDMFPGKIQEMCAARYSSALNIKSVLKEASLLHKSLDQVKAFAESLGDKPLIVITAGKSLGEQTGGLSEEEVAQITETWNGLQKELVAKSTRGSQIIAEHSGHMIPHEQPDIIVEAIREMCNSLRK